MEVDSKYLLYHNSALKILVGGVQTMKIIKHTKYNRERQNMFY